MAAAIMGSAGFQDHSGSPGAFQDNSTLLADYIHGSDTGIVSVQNESLYDIRFVNKETLDQLESHYRTDSLLLRITSGIPIGLATPEILYIRADLSEDFFPDIPVDLTKDDISRHLVDIVFGPDNTNTSLFKSDKDYKFFFTDQYSQEDISSILSFARFFNNVSNTAQFEDEEVDRSYITGNYENEPYYHYNITIISPESFKEIEKDKKAADISLRTNNGNLIGILKTDHLILSDILSQQENNYFMLRGLITSLGFHGETSRYKDSFFARDSYLRTNFSPIDIEAMRLLYGGRLRSEMNREATEKALNIYLQKKKKILGDNY